MLTEKQLKVRGRMSRERCRANREVEWLTTPNAAWVLGCHVRQVPTIALRSGIRTQTMPGRWLKFNREDCERVARDLKARAKAGSTPS